MTSYIIIAMILSVLIHESGHITAAKLLRIRLTGINLSVYGLRLNTAKILSYRSEFLLAAGGPLTNLLTAAGAMVLSRILGTGVFDDFISSSLCYAALNLVPIKEFDGGRIIFCTAALLSSEKIAEKLLDILSTFFIFIFWLISVYLMIRSSSALSLFAFSLLLFCRSCSDSTQK